LSHRFSESIPVAPHCLYASATGIGQSHFSECDESQVYSPACTTQLASIQYHAFKGT